MHIKIEVNQLLTQGNYTSAIYKMNIMMLNCLIVHGVENSIKIFPWNKGA